MKIKGRIALSAAVFMSCVSVGVMEGETVKADGNGVENIAIEERVFPDEKFRAYVEEYVDLNQNRLLEENEIESCETMNLYQKEIQSLEGIQFFVKLEKLNCGKNQLTQLDLTGCEALTILDCSKNKINSLNIQDNMELEELNCRENRLEQLDLQKKQSLQYLDCSNNQLQELDLIEVTALKEIYCGENNIEVLDFSKTSNITSICCGDSQISSLQLQGCDKLELLECDNGKLASLDVSGCESLMFLSCNNNKITGTLDLSGFSKLQTVNCNNNQISEIKCDDCDALTEVFCDTKVVVTGVDEQYIYKNEEITLSVTPEPSKALDATKIPTSIPNAQSYSIKYQMQGGKNNAKNPTTYSAQGTKLYEPSRKDYSFEGWYLDNDFKNKVTEISPNTKGNLTLYAKWSKVKVAKVTLKSAKRSGANKIKVTFKKVSKAKGYEISYAQNKKFKKAKNLTTGKTTYTIKKLKKGKTYYVRVRAYKYDSTKKKVYGKHSNTKKVIIKK